jgi:predicted TIM-barrel fold metal-dependent hydrolase
MAVRKGPIVRITDHDRAFYEERIRDFLPQRVIDAHTHLWVRGGRRSASRARDDRGGVAWPSVVARRNSAEDLAETYRLMLPDQQVTPLVFPTTSLLLPGAAAEGDLASRNRYVLRASKTRRWPALILSRPEWTGRQLEDRIAKAGFLGAKVYPDLAPCYVPPEEIRIFDYLPHHHLEVLNRRGWIAMLHIPRPGRLRDPVNLAQMLEIERRYPKVQLIIAHVGRAYCNEDVGRAFEVLAETRRMVFDISANTNQWVFERLIEAVGPGRILFGTDMPILRMRSRRVCENGTYVNLVPRGLYRGVKGLAHMREVAGREARKLTFFLYEEIDAFRRAAEATGLSRADVRRVFHDNAARMIRRAHVGAGHARR